MSCHQCFCLAVKSSLLVTDRNPLRGSKFRENKVETHSQKVTGDDVLNVSLCAFHRSIVPKTKLTVALRSHHLLWMGEGEHGWRQWQGGGMVGQDITLLQEKKGQRQSVKVLADPLHCSWLPLLGTLAANRSMKETFYMKPQMTTPRGRKNVGWKARQPVSV